MKFEAMGSWAEVIVVGGRPGLEAEARARVEDLEARWSPFRPDSEVSRPSPARSSLRSSMREGPGGRGAPARFGGPLGPWGPRAVSPDTALLLGRSALGADVVGGFDPWAGGRYDPGAIGKGLAAVLVVGALLAAGAAGACVNLGGDLRAEGAAPSGGSWVVAVEGTGVRLVLDGGAVATSSRARRGDHVLDPRNGLPARTDVASVTVLAAEAWWAEVLATGAFVAGAEAGLGLVAAHGATGLAVDRDGRLRRSPGLERFEAAA